MAGSEEGETRTTHSLGNGDVGWERTAGLGGLQGSHYHGTVANQWGLFRRGGVTSREISRMPLRF